jgi:hypothetical protein
MELLGTFIGKESIGHPADSRFPSKTLLRMRLLF